MTPRNNQPRFSPAHRPPLGVHGTGQPLRPVHHNPAAVQQRTNPARPQPVLDVMPVVPEQPGRNATQLPSDFPQPVPKHNQYHAHVVSQQPVESPQEARIPQMHMEAGVQLSNRRHQSNVSAHPISGDSVISIRLTIPNPKRLKVPPLIKQYPAFWWLLAFGAALLFTIGYQVGWHHHIQAKPAVIQPAFLYSTQHSEAA